LAEKTGIPSRTLTKKRRGSVYTRTAMTTRVRNTGLGLRRREERACEGAGRERDENDERNCAYICWFGSKK
jgi:hypothetical protein